MPVRQLNLLLPATSGGPRDKLWDRDVVELFLGDDWKNIRHYREFEIAPTGDWIDLAIDLNKESYDEKWNSGWQTQGRIDEKNHVWYAATRIPLKSVSEQPVKAGTKWRANLYRIDGQGPDRAPSFHVLAAHLRGEPRSQSRAGEFWNPDLRQINACNSFRFLTLILAVAACFTRRDGAGKKRFRILCAGCHGADGTGGERGPALVGRPDSRMHSAEIRATSFATGFPRRACRHSACPPREFEDLVAYVHSLRSRRRETQRRQATSRRANSFFQGKGNCAACHRVQGRGGWIGPDLSDVGATTQPGGDREALKDPGAGTRRDIAVATVRLRDGHFVARPAEEREHVRPAATGPGWPHASAGRAMRSRASIARRNR